MNRRASYPYPQTAPSSRYPATSSAFSASANPNEDWTRISDLAERRRIQNRIAQRNYRKKLKKRLEDLERRAASNSESPEQRPAELQKQPSPRKNSSQRPQPVQEPIYMQSSTPEHSQPAYLPLPDDRMFSHQYTRQLSTSPPPPFTYPLQSEGFSYPSYSTALPYATIPVSADMGMYSYQAPFTAGYPSPLPPVEFNIKPELYPENDLSSFNISYAPIPSIEITAGSGYPESSPQVNHPLPHSSF